VLATRTGIHASRGSCIVLSDHERERLREVERRLLSEDPTFARSFDARARRLSPAFPDRVGFAMVLVAGLLLSALMLVIGSLVGAAAFGAGTGLIWLAWRFGGGTHHQSR
jgi:hypothetical protein